MSTKKRGECNVSRVMAHRSKRIFAPYLKPEGVECVLSYPNTKTLSLSSTIFSKSVIVETGHTPVYFCREPLNKLRRRRERLSALYILQLFWRYQNLLYLLSHPVQPPRSLKK